MYVKTYKSSGGGLEDEEKDEDRKSKHLGDGDCFCPHVCISWNRSMELGRVHAIEYKVMRLVVGTTGFAKEAWPEKVQKVTLTQQEEDLSVNGKLRTAQQLVSNNRYQAYKERIVSKCTECKDALAENTRNVQGKSIHISKEIVKKLEVCMSILVILVIAISIMIRRLIVQPLLSYNQSIKNGEIFG